MKIKILFITNILSQHQVGLWDEFAKNKNIEFVYLCTRTNESLIESRYKTENRKYVRNSNDYSNDELLSLILSQNFLIVGSVEDERVNKLIYKKENIIWACEHFSKKNRFRKNILKAVRSAFRFKKSMERFIGNISLNNYLFCLSSHTSKDWRLGGFNKDRIFKFGYFPILDYASSNEITNKDIYNIVWSGRFIKWKHPEAALYILKKLLKTNKQYHLNYYGSGLLLENIKNKVKNSNLSTHVTFHGEVNPDQMKKEFLNAGICIFSSDYGEGWGSVLGEALASGCIVFADKRAGSTNYLVDKKSGFAYKGKISLDWQIKKYLKQKNSISMRLKAIDIMKYFYSGKEASKRLYQFILCLYNKEKFKPYDEGPLSKD